MGVRVGTIVVYARQWNEIGPEKDTIVATGLDDKVGISVAHGILQRLPEYFGNGNWNTKYTVYLASCVQEETGLRGAKLVARAIDPDISIDFDVTFCSDGGIGIDKSKVGDVKLGKGCVINYGPDKSERLNAVLSKYKDEHQSIASRAGGTNTKSIQECATDCETTIVSIPNRNMHTQTEMVSKRDIMAAIGIVSSAIIDKKI